MKRTKYAPSTIKENERTIVLILSEMQIANQQRRKGKWKRYDKKLFIAQKHQIKLKNNIEW